MTDATSHPQLYARVPIRLQAFIRDMLAYIGIVAAFLMSAILIPIEGVTPVLVMAAILTFCLDEPVLVTWLEARSVTVA